MTIIFLDKIDFLQYNETVDAERLLYKLKGCGLVPPKPKFTREEIVETALALVSENGMSALTSRDLGARLGSSARPIFTVFSSMEEVQEAVRSAAMERFAVYAHKAGNSIPVFKRVGMQMILFAKEEPELYKLIFMSSDNAAGSFDDIYDQLGTVADECLDAIKKDYGLTESSAKKLFEHVWIYTYGIGTMCATNMCDFSADEISQMLTCDFTAMMMLIKSENN